MQSDADALLDTVKELNATAQLHELDEAAVQKLSFTARGDLAPVNAFIGGLAAQEVIKVNSTTLVALPRPGLHQLTCCRCPPQACSRKLTPLRQWFYFDALECLPEEEDKEGEVTRPETDFSGVCKEDTLTFHNSSML